MNISKSSFCVALISLLGISLHATPQSPTPTMRWAGANFAGCLLSGLTTLHIIKLYRKAPERTQKGAFGLIVLVPAAVSACYTCYHTGLSAYTLYKKAYAPEKSLSNDSENLTSQKKLNTEKNTAVDISSTQKIINV